MSAIHVKRGMTQQMVHEYASPISEYTNILVDEQPDVGSQCEVRGLG